MNKYSSKAIKTAATVGMSLAMVLSAVPAVGNATVAQATITNVESARTTATEAHKILSKVLDAINDYTELYMDDKVVDSDITVDLGAPAGQTYDIAIVDTVTLSDLGALQINSKGVGGSTSATRSDIADETTLLELANYLVANSYAMDAADVEEDVLDFAKFIKGYSKGIANLGTYFSSGDWASSAATNKSLVESIAVNGVKKENATTARTIYKVLNDNAKYLKAVLKNNVSGSEGKGAAIVKTIDEFKAEVETFNGEYEDLYNKEYVKALEGIELVSGVTVYDAVEKDASISYKNVSKVEAVLKNIKNDKISTLTDAAKYDDVKGSEEVTAYVEGIESIISDMKEVKALLKTTNDDVKTYKKDLTTKVNALVTAIKNYATTNTDTYESALDAKLNAFREDDAKALKTIVENYVGQFFTLTPKQLNSGNYVVRLEDADLGRYVTTADVFDVLEKNSGSNGLQYLLTNVIDKTMSADTYYDTLINEVSTVEELLKAVTTDIEGITMGSTLTDKQAAKIIAAKKAINQLVTNGKIATEYATALTSKEKKAVLANAELIETLYFKLIMNGTVTESGWVDKGNGDWDYIAEDGSRPTKWVASGANWYYVKNGTMLRNSWIASDAQGTRWYYVDGNGVMVSNTTVNGYTFNSYGVWVK